MNVRPLHDYVIIRRKEEEHLSAGGIVIPDAATEKPVQGEVLTVGNGRIDKQGKVVPPDVKSGDRVLFGEYAGTEIKLEDEELFVMHETDIMAVLEE
ncbi:MAG: co-chaperone GroES [Gammaproteobacteria bacterium]|nr:co-chaperone GroES [Gammaproteobacteria bacterium]